MKKFLIAVFFLAIAPFALAFDKHPDGSITLTPQEVEALQKNIGEMVQINQAAIQYIEELEKALAVEKSKKCM